MFNVKVTRKKMAAYPATFAKINREFLPLAAKVVIGEAKTRVPVDTGILRGSIVSKVTHDKAIVGTSIEYAQHVEYGTRKMSAQPYLRPALDSNRKGLVELYRRILRSVFNGRQR